MDEKYLYFYDNIDKLLSDNLLLSDKDPLVKVEDLFNIDFKFNLDKELTDSILVLYLLCIHKMYTIKHENVIRRKLIQFFNYHKEKIIQTGGGRIEHGRIEHGRIEHGRIDKGRIDEGRIDEGLIEESHIILLKNIKQYIRYKVSLIQSKPAIKHLE